MVPARKKVLLSLPGCCGLYPLVIKVGFETKKWIQQHYPDHEIEYAGTSAGCAAALALALDWSEETIHQVFTLFESLFDQWYKAPILHWYTALRDLCRLSIKPDAYLQLSGKLHLAVTELNGYKPQYKVYSHFNDNEHLINLMLASSHLFIFALSLFRKVNDKYMCDGGFFSNQITLPSDKYINVVVNISSFRQHLRWSDVLISPKMHKFKRLYQAGSHAHIVDTADGHQTVCKLRSNKGCLSQCIVFLVPVIAVYCLLLLATFDYEDF